MCSTALAYAFLLLLTRSQVKGIIASAALAVAIGTPSQLPDGRPRDGGDDGDERGGAQHAAGALVSRPQPPSHVPTPRFAGSPGAMPWPAAQQSVAPRARRRSLDKPAGLRVHTDCGSAGGGGRRGRRRSAISCWPAPCHATALGLCLALGGSLCANACPYGHIRSYIRILFVDTAYGVTRRAQWRRAAGVRSRSFAKYKIGTKCASLGCAKSIVVARRREHSNRNSNRVANEVDTYLTRTDYRRIGAS